MVRLETHWDLARYFGVESSALLLPGFVPYDWEGMELRTAPAAVATFPRTGRDSARRKYYTLAPSQRVDPTVKRWGNWVIKTLCRRWAISEPVVLEFVHEAAGPGEFVVKESETRLRAFMKPIGGGQMFINVAQSPYEQIVSVGHEMFHFLHYSRGWDESASVEVEADTLGRRMADEVLRRNVWLPR